MEEKNINEKEILDFEEVKEEIEKEEILEEIKETEQVQEDEKLILVDEVNYEEIEEEILEEIKEDKNKSTKKKIIALVAVLLSLAGIITSCMALKKKNKKPNDKEPVEITTPLEIEETISLDDIGETVDLNDETKAPEEIYSNPTGDIDPEKIVEKDNELYVDQEAADNKDKVGETFIDDKGGKLEITPSGTVVEKDENAEIKKEDGTVVTEKINPDTNLPNGAVHDENLNKDVKEEDANKYVYVEQDYYRVSDGSLVWSKGEIVTKETLEKIKNDKNLTTIKPVIETTPSTPETSTPETKPSTPETESNIDSLGGITNPDGTYTIYGITYMDKATFESFVIDENASANFGFYKGVVYPIEVIKEMSKQGQKSR